MLDPPICQHVCLVFVDHLGWFLQNFMEQSSRNAMPGSRIARFEHGVASPRFLCLMFWNGWNGWPR